MKSFRKAFNTSSEPCFLPLDGDSNRKENQLENASLEEFELQTVLGTGTFGRVSLAFFRPKDGREPEKKYYAIKVLKKEKILSMQQVEHVKAEVGLLKQINHRFIVNMVCFFQDDHKIYMVLDYVLGGELFTFLREVNTLASDEAQYYAGQIIFVFAYLHARKIAYRDLKPENILITRSGQVKLADFGFAKVVESKTWTLCGTPEYLAPEIIQSKGHGIGVDYWALGILIYEMLCGYPPFYDDNPFEIYQKILVGEPTYPNEMPTKAVNLVCKLLQADLSRRLGCTHGGVGAIQKAKWFKSLDWEALYNGEYDAPFVPAVSGEADTSNFDEYPESPELMDGSLTEEDAVLFADLGEYDEITRHDTPVVTPPVEK